MATLTCLFPVRNGSRYLPLFLSQASEYLDEIVALDDGSTDDTNHRLRQSRLVSHVIEHTARSSYADWDDLRNRNELLQHLTDRQHRGWVLFLDADELLDIDDARLLRGLLRGGQLDPGTAYGFQVFRMIEDLDHYDKEPLTVFRLFYFQPGHVIAGGRLHFEPVPSQVAATSWQPSRLRIKHRSSLTPELRRERFDKYREADPACAWQESYANLLDEPRNPRPWSQTSWSGSFLIQPVERSYPEPKHISCGSRRISRNSE